MTDNNSILGGLLARVRPENREAFAEFLSETLADAAKEYVNAEAEAGFQEQAERERVETIFYPGAPLDQVQSATSSLDYLLSLPTRTPEQEKERKRLGKFIESTMKKYPHSPTSNQGKWR